jgi:hypothetical protein
LIGVIWWTLQKRIDRLQDEIDAMRQDARDTTVRLFEAIDKVGDKIDSLTLKIAEGYVSRATCDKFREECLRHREGNRS